MITKRITSTDFNGVETTETFHFNLTKAELMDMELSTEGGMSGMLQKIVDTKSTPKLYAIFKEFIQKSYGIKSDDGKRFIKSPELTKAFMETNAYVELYMELASDAAIALEFIKGVMPPMSKEQEKQVDAEIAKQLKANAQD